MSIPALHVIRLADGGFAPLPGAPGQRHLFRPDRAAGEPAAEKVPLGHAVQVALPTPAQRPAAHCVHDPSPAAAANPARHTTRLLLPLQSCPAGHCAHVRSTDVLGAVPS